MSRRYGYARVSTETQRLDRQIKNITNYTGELKVDKIFKEKFTGTKLDRPEFQRLLKVLLPGDTIIFDSVSRMSRDAEEGYNLYMELMEERQINLEFIKEPHINTDYYKRMASTKIKVATSGKESVDKMIHAILDAVNEFWQAEKEVKDLHNRISEGIATTKRKNQELPPEERKQMWSVSKRASRSPYPSKLQQLLLLIFKFDINSD